MEPGYGGEGQGALPYAFTGVKVLHFIWLQGAEALKTDKPHLWGWVQSWVKHFPQWAVKVWSARDLETFLAAHDPEAAKQYARMTTMAAKSDLGRYALMHYVGGMYVDTDMECLGNFAGILAPGKLSLIFDSGNVFPPFDKLVGHTNNCWMYAASPGLPATRALLDHVLTLLRGTSDEDMARGSSVTVTYTTGPGVLWDAMKDRSDINWIPYSLVDPINARNSNFAYLAPEELARRLPDARAVHRPQYSWLDVGNREFVDLGAYSYQYLPIIAIVLFLLVIGLLASTTALGVMYDRTNSRLQALQARRRAERSQGGDWDDGIVRLQIRA
jgi:hypothetical protein